MLTKTLTYGVLIGFTAVAAFALLGASSAPTALMVEAAGGDPIFIKFDGIDGESTAVGHRDEIDVLSWSWGMSQSGTSSGGGGGGAGKASFQDLHFTKTLDKSTPKLMQALATGEHIRRVELSLNDPGKTPTEFMKIVLEDVLVSSYSISGSTNDARPTESISLNFAKVEVQYQQLDAKGGKVGGPAIFGWDLKENKGL